MQFFSGRFFKRLAIGVLILLCGAYSFAKYPSQKEIQDWIRLMTPEQRERIEKDPFLKQKLLNHIREVDALYKKALKDKFDRDPEVQLKLRLVLKETLARMWLERKVQEKLNKFRISEQDLRRYYETHPEEFKDLNGKILPFHKIRWMIEKKLKEEYRRNVVRQIINEALTDP